MRTGVIGAGKVGFSLGKFFEQGGVRLSGYYSRNPESAKEAAAFTNSRYYSDLGELVRDSDAIFITVPDGTIESVYRKLLTFQIQGKYLCHCSGVLTAEDAFPAIRVSGAYGVSVHPLFPVSSKYDSYRELRNAFFCLEGDRKAVSVFRTLLENLGVPVRILSPEAKVRYHAGCVTASNFVCALAQESIELLTGCGFTEEDARRAIAPLMRSNLEHLLETGPAAALTGPVERNDITTVHRHLEHLETAEQQMLYCQLSQKLVEMARQKHPEQDYGHLSELINHNIRKEEIL